MKRPESISGPLASMTEEDWNIVWRQLRVFVRAKYFWFYLRTGYSLDGIAHEAVIAVLNGSRRYPPIDKETGLERSDVSLLAFLCETIRSHVSHLCERHRRIPPPSRLDDLSNPLQVQNASEPGKSVSSKHVKVEGDVGYELFIAELLALVKGDSLLSQMVRMWSEDPNLKPGEMADALGLEMKVLRNAQKRLRRRLKKLLGEGYD